MRREWREGSLVTEVGPTPNVVAESAQLHPGSPTINGPVIPKVDDALRRLTLTRLRFDSQ